MLTLMEGVCGELITAFSNNKRSHNIYKVKPVRKISTILIIKVLECLLVRVTGEST